MTRKQIDVLRRMFPTLTTTEIVQELLLAELRTQQGALATCIAKRRLTDTLRREIRYTERFASYDAHGFDEDELGHHDLDLERYFSGDEWHAIVVGLPYPAQKLAKIARCRAEQFEDVPGGIWTRDNLTELRRRIKRKLS